MVEKKRSPTFQLLRERVLELKKQVAELEAKLAMAEAQAKHQTDLLSQAIQTLVEWNRWAALLRHQAAETAAPAPTDASVRGNCQRQTGATHQD